MFDQFSIAYTNYIRTTEEKHRQAVRHVWKELAKKDFIYKGSYQGWYAVQDEAFVSEEEVSIRLVEARAFSDGTSRRSFAHVFRSLKIRPDKWF